GKGGGCRRPRGNRGPGRSRRRSTRRHQRDSKQCKVGDEGGRGRGGPPARYGAQPLTRNGEALNQEVSSWAFRFPMILRNWLTTPTSRIWPPLCPMVRRTALRSGSRAKPTSS